MGKSKHTPGPWLATPKSGGEWYVDSTDWCIAVVFGGAGLEGFNGASDANARLIAAAPDMYAELEVRVGDLVMLRKAIEAGDPRNELFVRIDDMLRDTRASLAKAEGK